MVRFFSSFVFRFAFRSWLYSLLPGPFYLPQDLLWVTLYRVNLYHFTEVWHISGLGTFVARGAGCLFLLRLDLGSPVLPRGPPWLWRSQFPWISELLILLLAGKRCAFTRNPQFLEGRNPCCYNCLRDFSKNATMWRQTCPTFRLVFWQTVIGVSDDDSGLRLSLDYVSQFWWGFIYVAVANAVSWRRPKYSCRFSDF